MSPSFFLPLLPSLFPTKQHGDRQGPATPGGDGTCMLPDGYRTGNRTPASQAPEHVGRGWSTGPFLGPHVPELHA